MTVVTQSGPPCQEGQEVNRKEQKWIPRVSAKPLLSSRKIFNICIMKIYFTKIFFLYS